MEKWQVEKKGGGESKLGIWDETETVRKRMKQISTVNQYIKGWK